MVLLFNEFLFLVLAITGVIYACIIFTTCVSRLKLRMTRKTINNQVSKFDRIPANCINSIPVIKKEDFIIWKSYSCDEKDRIPTVQRCVTNSHNLKIEFDDNHHKLILHKKINQTGPNDFQHFYSENKFVAASLSPCDKYIYTLQSIIEEHEKHIITVLETIEGKIITKIVKDPAARWIPIISEDKNFLVIFNKNSFYIFNLKCENINSLEYRGSYDFPIGRSYIYDLTMQQLSNMPTRYYIVSATLDYQWLDQTIKSIFYLYILYRISMWLKPLISYVIPYVIDFIGMTYYS